MRVHLVFGSETLYFEDLSTSAETRLCGIQKWKFDERLVPSVKPIR